MVSYRPISTEAGKIFSFHRKISPDPQTEADIRAQHFIATSLRRRFTNLHIVGEEDLEDTSNTLLQKLVDECIDLDTTFYAGKDGDVPPLLRELDADDVTVWIDPLDGTKEYTLGVVENVTTLIGISYRGFSLAGVIAIPFCNQLIAAGMGVGLHVEGDLSIQPSCHIPPIQAMQIHPYWRLYLPASGSAAPPIPATPSPGPLVKHTNSTPPPTIVTSRSHMTPQITALLSSLNIGQVLRVGGAGNKGVKIITGAADAYVFPQTGTKRWDICAVQAVLEACGGQLTNSYGQIYGYYRDDAAAKVWLRECARAELDASALEGVVEGAKIYLNDNGVLASLKRVVHSSLTLPRESASQFARM